MAESKAEQIEARVLALLSVISVANGYNYDYKQISRWLEKPGGVNDHPAIFCPPGPEGDAGSDRVSSEERIKVVPIWGYHDDPAVPIGTKVQRMRQDIEKALLASGTNLGLDFVRDTKPGEIRSWQVTSAKPLEILRMEFHVTYVYDRLDP